MIFKFSISFFIFLKQFSSALPNTPHNMGSIRVDILTVLTSILSPRQMTTYISSWLESDQIFLAEINVVSQCITFKTYILSIRPLILDVNFDYSVKLAQQILHYNIIIFLFAINMWCMGTASRLFKCRVSLQIFTQMVY